MNSSNFDSLNIYMFAILPFILLMLYIVIFGKKDTRQNKK